MTASNSTKSGVPNGEQAGLQSRLECFLDDARPLLDVAHRAATEGQVHSLLPSRLEATLQQLHAPLAIARSRGSSINPWSVAGLARNEVRNSAVLAEFFRLSAGGDSARLFLSNLLKRVVVPERMTLPQPEDLDRGYTVACEQCPMGDLKDRIDLLIEGADFLIGIEIKIDAGLGPEQLERYIKALDERSQLSRKHPSIIFLAPFAPPAVCPVGRVSWQDVAIAARQIIPKRTSDQTPYHTLLEHFAEHISNF